MCGPSGWIVATTIYQENFLVAIAWHLLACVWVAAALLSFQPGRLLLFFSRLLSTTLLRPAAAATKALLRTDRLTDKQFVLWPTQKIIGISSVWQVTLAEFERWSLFRLWRTFYWDLQGKATTIDQQHFLVVIAWHLLACVWVEAALLSFQPGLPSSSLVDC